MFRIEDCATSKAPGRLIRRIDRVMAATVEARFQGFDLSYLQWVALRLVRDGLAGTAGELARELGITTGATTRMVDVLEARGLIARDRAGADRRVVRLALTPAGGDTVQCLGTRVVRIWNQAFEGFGEGEATRLVADLARLLEAAERLAIVGEVDE